MKTATGDDALPHLLDGLDRADLDQVVLALQRHHHALQRDHRRPAPGLLLLAYRVSERASAGQSGTTSAASESSGHARSSPDDLLTYQELAEMSGYSERTLKRRVAAGSLRAVRDGRLVRIRRCEWVDYLDRKGA